jgi:negative regulator of replication initiation
MKPATTVWIPLPYWYSTNPNGKCPYKGKKVIMNDSTLPKNLIKSVEFGGKIIYPPKK